MVQLPNWLKDKSTREIISWVGGGVALIVCAGWAVYTHYDTAENNASSPQVTATAASGGVAVGGDIGSGGVAVGTMTGGSISTGPSDEHLRRVVAETLAQETSKDARIAELSRALDIRDTAIVTFFRTLEEKQVPPERWPEKLAEIAERFKQSQAQFTTVPEDPPEIAQLRADAKSALDKGDLDEADALLAQVIAAQYAAAAATAAQRGTIALTRLRYTEAAAHFAAAAGRVPDGNEDQRLVYLSQEAKALYLQGDQLGDNTALVDAIERLEVMLELRPRDLAPLEWASTQNSLGIVLSKLGEREPGTQRQEAAVTAYRNALEEWSRECYPMQWAAAQNNLGIALSISGEREPGTGRLQEAESAFRAALEEWTRDLAPDKRCLAQINLGGVLTRLGSLERDIKRLEEAVSLYQEALQACKRDEMPLEWALIQANLAGALLCWGEQEPGTVRLDEAVTASRAALEVRTRDGHPYLWAKTQLNLAGALLHLGNRRRDLRSLIEAREAVAGAREVAMEVGHVQWLARLELSLRMIEAAIADLEVKAP